MTKKRVTLIGKLPTPIGGVTMYNKRLVESLHKENYEIDIINLNKLNGNTASVFFNSELVHLSISNSYIKFLLILASKIFLIKVITTLHGSYGRYSKFRNYIEILCVKLSDKTLLLNDRSYKDLDQYKSKLILSSTDFELSSEELPKRVLDRINKLKNEYEKIFCTNSWKLTFDKNGNEIYSISKLMIFFTDLQKYSLVISDPSGTNRRYIEDSLNLKITNNVIFITEDHSFAEILKISDGFIRATTTDGDALSVREAISLGIPVFASDSIDRPDECILFNLGSLEMLNSKLKEKSHSIIVKENKRKNKLINEIINLYNSLL